MFFNIKIYSTKEPNIKDLVEAEDVLRTMKGVDDIEFVWGPLNIDALKTKQYPDGDVKIDWESFGPYILDGRGLHAYCIALTTAEAKKLGIKGVKGSYDSDHDNTMEFFIAVDRKDKTPRNRTKFSNDWVRVFLHELCHGCERFLHGYQGQLTHEYDYEKKDLRSLFKQWDWTDWGKKKSLLDTLKEEFSMMLGNKLLKPIPEKYWGNSRKYGVKAPEYKVTGIHIGQDHALPEHTALVAPCNGEIIESGKSKELGFYQIFHYTFKGQEYWERHCHLYDIMHPMKLKRGEFMGYSGNTGMTTGPHLHQDIWTIFPKISVLTKDNYTEYTIDPIKHYG
jgi:hypothetical protein